MKIPQIVAAGVWILALGMTHVPAEETDQATIPPAAEKTPDVLVSPDKRFELKLIQPAEPGKYPLMVLRDLKSGQALWEFDYAEVDEWHTGELDAAWTPDSRHLAVTIQVARVIGTTVLSVHQEKVEEVEFLPVPAKLNKKSYTTRGGEFFSHWESNTSLWLNDNTRNRSFRYSLTKEGKLLADAFKDDPE